jgi:hypothetical protein
MHSTKMLNEWNLIAFWSYRSLPSKRGLLIHTLKIVSKSLKIILGTFVLCSCQICSFVRFVWFVWSGHCCWLPVFLYPINLFALEEMLVTWAQKHAGRSYCLSILLKFVTLEVCLVPWQLMHSVTVEMFDYKAVVLNCCSASLSGHAI